MDELPPPPPPLALHQVLGAGSWSETPALLERFGGSAGPTGASEAAGIGAEPDEEETHHPAIVPCDKPLLPHEQELLTEAAVIGSLPTPCLKSSPPLGIDALGLTSS